MRRHVASFLVRLLRQVAHAVVGAVIIGVVAFVFVLDSRPDLSVWHQVHLDAEYTTQSQVTDFEGYLELEAKLFEQLDNEVIARVQPGPDTNLNRFSRGSLSDPARWSRNWNRSFEMRADAPRASALRLHGLTDAPYSMRSLAEMLHTRGVSVLGLRVPGHGTAPSGLVHVRWEDMEGAVELAARHLHERDPSIPLFVVGYSNGGALAVEYTLSAIQEPDLPKPDGVVLISPEIGVTELAVLAGWQRRLGRVLGLAKLSWSSVEPEYDPFKYNSFAINGGDVVYRITRRIQDHLDVLEIEGKLGDTPRLIAFQSSVDATVSAPALVEHLFDRLARPDHELVLFDVKRTPKVESMLVKDPRTIFKPLLASSTRGFTLTMVTNEESGSESVVARTSAPGEDMTQAVQNVLQASWPHDVYSVGHIALPFSPLDPLYGGPQAPASPGIRLGDIDLRGESGVLKVSAKSLLRLHWNPFHAYVEQRMLEFMELGELSD